MSPKSNDWYSYEKEERIHRDTKRSSHEDPCIRWGDVATKGLLRASSSQEGARKNSFLKLSERAWPHQHHL